MKTEDLIALGFVDTSWSHEGENFTEHILSTKDFKIEITGVNLVEIGIDMDYIAVPNCHTIEDLKRLLKLLGI